MNEAIGFQVCRDFESDVGSLNVDVPQYASAVCCLCPEKRVCRISSLGEAVPVEERGTIPLLSKSSA